MKKLFKQGATDFRRSVFNYIGLLALVLFACGATPILNAVWQGVWTNDANAGGKSIANLKNVTATNTITARNFVGSGADLTDLPAPSGTVPDSRTLTAVSPIAGGGDLTANRTFYFAGTNAFNASGATNLNAGNLTSGTVPIARVPSIPATLLSATNAPSTDNVYTYDGTAAYWKTPASGGSPGSQSPNIVYAGPATGSAAAPTFRALVSADLPAITFASLTSKPVTISGYGITDAQPLNSNLTTLAGLTIAKGNLYVGTGSGTLTMLAVGSNGQILTADSAQTSGVKWATGGGGGVTSIDLTAGTTGVSVSGGPITTSGSITVSLSAPLVSIAGLTTSSDQMIYTTGSNVYATTGITSFSRTLLANSSASAARTTLNLVIGTDILAYSSELNAAAAVSGTGFIKHLAANNWAVAQVDLTTNVTGTLPLANGGTGATSASAARTSLGLDIGTNVQAYDADLTVLAGVTYAKGGITIGTGSAAASLLTVGSDGQVLTADSTQTNGVKWATSSSSAVNPTAVGLRMSMSSSDPYGTGSGTTLYVHAASSSYIPLYDTTALAWTLFDIGSSPASFSLTLTSGSVYDVFAYNNSGTLALDFVVWTNATTRATALATQNGVLVKNGAANRRWLGTVTASATNTITVNGSDCGIDNEYNRAELTLIAEEPSSTPWTYNSTTYREINGGSTLGVSRVRSVTGRVRESITADVSGTAFANATGYFSFGVGINSTSTQSATGYGGYTTTGNASIHSTAHFGGKLPIGLNVISRLENSSISISFEGTTTQRKGAMIVVLKQ